MMRNIVHGTATGYQYGCRCDDCRKAKTTRQREYLKRKAHNMQLVPNSSVHGTLVGYATGCRCDLCKKTVNSYYRQYNKTYERKIPNKPVPHGTVTGYLNYSCRCNDCTEAWRIKGQSRRDKLSGTTPPSHGTVYAYDVYSCRCQECSKAKSMKNKKRKKLK